jgi:hypothetical protein
MELCAAQPFAQQMRKTATTGRWAHKTEQWDAELGARICVQNENAIK